MRKQILPQAEFAAVNSGPLVPRSRWLAKSLEPGKDMPAYPFPIPDFWLCFYAYISGLGECFYF
ncbi:hypothetical protein LBYZC6_39780 [Lacrimispora brassicae]